MDGKIKLPNFIKYFMFIYIGVIGVMNLTGVDMGVNIFSKVFWAVSLSIFTSLAAYGFISLLEDFRSGGYKFIIRKIRRFF